MTTKEGINNTLKIIGAAGFDGVDIAAPNASQALNLLINKSPKNISNQDKVLKEIKRQGLVYITQEENTLHFTITPAGVYRLQKNIIDELKIPKPKSWDKKWRILSFEVPIRQSKERSYFTSHLKSLNFIMLQKSLWAYPFPCFEQIEQLAGYYNILRYCTLYEATRLDDISTKKMMRHFQQDIS